MLILGVVGTTELLTYALQLKIKQLNCLYPQYPTGHTEETVQSVAVPTEQLPFSLDYIFCVPSL